MSRKLLILGEGPNFQPIKNSEAKRQHFPYSPPENPEMLVKKSQRVQARSHILFDIKGQFLNLRLDFAGGFFDHVHQNHGTNRNS